MSKVGGGSNLDYQERFLKEVVFELRPERWEAESNEVKKVQFRLRKQQLERPFYIAVYMQ